MSRDLYTDFAARYDLTLDQFAAPDPMTVDFFRKLFGARRVKTVLDCACGTGRHIRLFHSLGCEVCGSDLSESMLAQARKNLAEYGIQVPLCQVDYRELPRHFRKQFDAVVCLGAIGYMPNEAEYLRAFASMNQVLRHGGILVLTAIPTDRQWKEKPRFMLAANNRDFSRLFVIDYLEQTVRYTILDIFHSEGANELKMWSAELSVQLRDNLERLLKTAGFGAVDFYGALDLASYDKTTSNHLIAVASK